MPSTYTQILEASIKNLRNSMTGLSLDQFLASTIDSLMEMERGEYLEQAKTNNKEEKGNGFYGRAFNSLCKNCLRIHVPRSRSGDFSRLVRLSMTNQFFPKYF
jgi:hypothetical protein